MTLEGNPIGEYISLTTAELTLCILARDYYQFVDIPLFPALSRFPVFITHLVMVFSEDLRGDRYRG